MNKELLRMQKLAGLITESELKEKLSLKEGLDPKDKKTLKIAVEQFLDGGGESKDPKAGDVLKYTFIDDNEKIKGEVPSEFVTIDDFEAAKYEARKIGKNKYALKVTVKKDVDKL